MNSHICMFKLLTTIGCFCVFMGLTGQTQNFQNKVNDTVMQKIYEEVKTPYKYGLVLVPPDSTKKTDCPTVFREGGKWYMTYIIFNGRGYETWLAESNELLNWKTLGRIMSFTGSTNWDDDQKAGYPALRDYKWGGSYELEKYDNKYWMSYFGGSTKGYERGLLSAGMAYTDKHPVTAHEWQRLDKPVLMATDTNVRWWENNTIYKSSVIHDISLATGYPFIMFYNARGDSLWPQRGAERIGMAVSGDMTSWIRFGRDPVINHHKGISGDAVIQRIGNIWVMFYFGAFWAERKDAQAFNRFACSYDLVNWTDWEGEDLIAPSEHYDNRFAHKSSVVKFEGVVYHFYCAVNKNDDRGIAVATSKDLGKSDLDFSYSCSDRHSRIIKDFNFGWKFYQGDDSLVNEVLYDDSKWRILNLPHDWSIEGEFSKDHPATTAGGALPTGTGWYRKTFTLPAESKDKYVYIDFDGIYRNSEVWINGHYLGKRPNGYISFRYDLTPYLLFGDKKNVIAVRVDNSLQPNSRWYTGSGIYRNVRLVITGNVHIDHWGTFVTTPEITDESAIVNLSIGLHNRNIDTANVSVKTVILDHDSRKVANKEITSLIMHDSLVEIRQVFTVNNPVLWSVEKPYLYRAITKVYAKNEICDSYETVFGIRYFKFDSTKGFSLNGKLLKILGVCNHHDLGAIGAAVNMRAIERRLGILKQMGCNAIRTAHNPPSPELLKLCDKMGFLVVDEAFDVWGKMKVKYDYHIDWEEWHRRDLQDLIKRDRNHPSVIMWCIGNEIREQFDSTGISVTRELVNIIKELDTTRPVTCALTENIPEKNFIYQSGALDILGFNYKHEAYADFPDTYPGEILVATENMSALATRGHYDMPSDSILRWPPVNNILFKGNTDFTVSAFDHVSAWWGSTHEETWKVIKKHDFISGVFVWTGFDYLGEPTPYPWPARSSYFGIVDLAGFPKDAYYMYQSEWTSKPVLHIFPHWNWESGETVDVWAYYNNADEVELYLNGESMGVKKKESDALHVMWRIKYQPGTLRAVSRENGKTVLIREVKTAGKPAKIELKADRNEINSGGYDLVFITVRVVDKNGILVPDAGNMITFDITGEGSIAGVDNGYQASSEPFKANCRKVYNGMCLAIVRSVEKAGRINLKAVSEGLQPASINIKSK